MGPLLEDVADCASGPIHQVRRIACFDGRGGDVTGRAWHDGGTRAKDHGRETDSRIR